MRQWLVAAIVSTIVHKILASCRYSDINSYILVADEDCIYCNTCYFDNKCNSHCFADTDDIFSHIPAVGTMTNYGNVKMTIRDSSETTLKDMILPNSLSDLTFENITKLNLNSAQTSSWSKVTSLRIKSCANSVTCNIKWPKMLTNLTIQKSNFRNISDLPTKLENLLNRSLADNSIISVVNQDWRTLRSLDLSSNPLETFANVQLSSALKFFNIKNTKLTNITIDQTTADALNALFVWDPDTERVGFSVNSNINTDRANCAAIGGEPQRLFSIKVRFNVTACVIKSSLGSTNSTTLIPNNENTKPTIYFKTSSDTGVIIGVIVGSLVIGTLLFFFIQRKIRQRSSNAPNLPSPKNMADAEGTDQSTPNDPRRRGRPYIDENIAELNVKYLENHRLVLADLIVTSSKPLGSGAFGEVWLGTYGLQQVAIKRLKSHEPRQVQKFIEEIVLMSGLNSDYIVKFIGASWTRPIEMECVVEYMDLGDLRSYLADHPPAQFPWKEKYECIMSIVQGLMYLHTYNSPIVHRDLKSSNVLLDSVKGTKLTDFGIARIAEDDDTMTNGIGTFQWMAPEVIAGTNYSTPADIYSFGIILSEFCTHQVPFAGCKKVVLQAQRLIEVGEGRLHPSFDGENVPACVKDIAMQCLQLNADDRPTAIQLFDSFKRTKEQFF